MPRAPAHETIGLIGIGLLGTALAERLLAVGFDVWGFDLDAERRRELERLGGTPASSAPEVGEQCRRIVLSLPDSRAVAAVVDEVRPHLAPDALVIDTTTGDPTETALLGEELAGYGIGYVDATVAGSSEQARRGEVVVMVGGPGGEVEDARNVLDAFARRVFHVGPWGSGARMKLVVNLVLGLNRAVLAEGLSFARACGIDPAAALAVLGEGPAYSSVMDTKGERMLNSEFAPEARLAQHLKDVRLILDTAARRGATTPLSALHGELLEALVALGYGEDDNSAIIRAFAVEAREPPVGPAEVPGS